jgi:hypothetical protein
LFLFSPLKAQNEASLLSEESVILKALTDSNTANSVVEKKLSAILQNVDGLIAGALDAEKQQNNALQGLSDGLVANLQSCRLV